MLSSTLNIIESADWLKEQNYIGGEWMGTDSGTTEPVEDPATAQTIGHIAWSASRYPVPAALYIVVPNTLCAPSPMACATR